MPPLTMMLVHDVDMLSVNMDGVGVEGEERT